MQLITPEREVCGGGCGRGGELNGWVPTAIPAQVHPSATVGLFPVGFGFEPTETEMSGLILLSLAFLLYAAFVFCDFPSFESEPAPGWTSFDGDFPGAELASDITPTLTDFSRATVGFVTAMVTIDVVATPDDSDVDANDTDEDDGNDDNDNVNEVDEGRVKVAVTEAAIVCEPRLPEVLLVATAETTLKEDFAADAALADDVFTDTPEDAIAAAVFTTSCLESSLFGILVRLIFIFKPLSTEEICAMLLLLMLWVMWRPQRGSGPHLT